MTKPNQVVTDGSWTHQHGDRYIVTGVDRNNRRFKRTYADWCWAAGINVWRGSKWLERAGRRYLLVRVFN